MDLEAQEHRQDGSWLRVIDGHGEACRACACARRATYLRERGRSAFAGMMPEARQRRRVLQQIQAVHTKDMARAMRAAHHAMVGCAEVAVMRRAAIRRPRGVHRAGAVRAGGHTARTQEQMDLQKRRELADAQVAMLNDMFSEPAFIVEGEWDDSSSSSDDDGCGGYYYDEHVGDGDVSGDYFGEDGEHVAPDVALPVERPGGLLCFNAGVPVVRALPAGEPVVAMRMGLMRPAMRTGLLRPAMRTSLMGSGGHSRDRIDRRGVREQANDDFMREAFPLYAEQVVRTQPESWVELPVCRSVVHDDGEDNVCVSTVCTTVVSRGQPEKK